MNSTAPSNGRDDIAPDTESWTGMLLAFFGEVARRETARMNSLREEPAFRVEPGRWLFNLPDLHRYLCARDPGLNASGYHEFRRALFHSPVNQSLETLGARITIAENHGHVDRSRYALVWREPSTAVNGGVLPGNPA